MFNCWRAWLAHRKMVNKLLANKCDNKICLAVNKYSYPITLCSNLPLVTALYSYEEEILWCNRYLSDTCFVSLKFNIYDIYLNTCVLAICFETIRDYDAFLQKFPAYRPVVEFV
jgi:hypothetical protein